MSLNLQKHHALCAMGLYRWWMDMENTLNAFTDEEVVMLNGIHHACQKECKKAGITFPINTCHITKDMQVLRNLKYQEDTEVKQNG